MSTEQEKQPYTLQQYISDLAYQKVDGEVVTPEGANEKFLGHLLMPGPEILDFFQKEVFRFADLKAEMERREAEEVMKNYPSF